LGQVLPAHIFLIKKGGAKIKFAPAALGYCQPGLAVEKVAFPAFSFSHSGQIYMLSSPQPNAKCFITISQLCLLHFAILSLPPFIMIDLKNKKASHPLIIVKLCLRDGKPYNFACCHPYSENKKTLLSALFSLIDSTLRRHRLSFGYGGSRAITNAIATYQA
jgi:hypothetical protein